MRGSPRSGKRPTPIPGAAATSACRPTTLMRRVPSGATWRPPGESALACAHAGSERRSWSRGASTILRQAESALAAGQADIVGFARQSLADPDWFRKVRLGRGHEVRLCTYTNYCEALDQRHRQVTCSRWDRLALDEPGVTLSLDGKRRLTAPPWEA